MMSSVFCGLNMTEDSSCWSVKFCRHIRTLDVCVCACVCVCVCVFQWHALSHSEQSKYYELAQKERLLHMQLYPGWSARDNYVRTAHVYCVYILCVHTVCTLCCVFETAALPSSLTLQGKRKRKRSQQHTGSSPRSANRIQNKSTLKSDIFVIKLIF